MRGFETCLVVVHVFLLGVVCVNYGYLSCLWLGLTVLICSCGVCGLNFFANVCRLLGKMFELKW